MRISIINRLYFYNIMNVVLLDELNNQNLKNIVIKWMELEEEISEIVKNLKDKKDEKKQFEEYILDNLDNNIKGIITSKYTIMANTLNSKKSISEDLIKSTLDNILKNPEQAHIITEQIASKREIKSSKTLKKKNLNV